MKISRLQPLVRPSAGFALGIVLPLVVLITLALVAFFLRSGVNRNIEASRTSQVLAPMAADSGVDYVVAGFLREIADNSVKVGQTYKPKDRKFSVPQRPLPADKFDNTAPPDDPNVFYNLLRRSVINETVNGVGEANASADTTATASANGRIVGSARWNSPALLSGQGLSSDNQLPCWIYLNDDGSATAVPSAQTTARFAYMVYDLGGLLDANAVGNPAMGGIGLASIKDTVAGADMTHLPAMGYQQPAVNKLCTFRDASAATPTEYPALVTEATREGFLKSRLVVGANPLNRRLFASRQDLIRYARYENADLAPALPYLTHFSRTLNSPSTLPETPPGSTIDYAAKADDSDSANRFLPGVVVVAPFTRLDGNPAKTGEPLVKHRFPLSRLSAFANGTTGLSSTGTTMTGGQIVRADASTVLRDFGLRRVGRAWVYDADGSNNIKLLSEIRNREPNFFELLKAGILSGSLNKAFVTDSNANYMPVAKFDNIPDGHIFQIGANIIDQYDADSYPTRIDGGTNPSGGTGYYFGIENLPYLNKIVEIVRRYEEDEAPYVKPRIGVWLSPVVWNPHADAPTPPTANAPTQFRFIMRGQACIHAEGTLGPMITFPDGASDGIRFASSKEYQNPYMLDGRPGRLGSSANRRANPLPSAAGNKDNQTARPRFGFVGLSVGDVIAPDPRISPVNQPWWPCRYTGAKKTPGLRGILQYQDGSNWVDYSELKFIPNDVNATWDESFSGFLYFSPRTYAENVDPRIIRFGAPDTYGYGLGIGLPPPPNGYINNVGRTARPDDGNTQDEQWWNSQRFDSPAIDPGWSRDAYSGGNPNHATEGCGYFGHLSDNLPSSPTRYKDNDGILRPADGAYSTPGTTTSTASAPGKPLRTDNFSSRPLILNRPFRSVAELGYASRGLPWKHLDFFTKESADAALLDLFSIEEEPAITAGRINPNTRNRQVIAALLQNSVISERDNTTISAADATEIARRLVVRTTNPSLGPLRDRADLVTSFARDITFANNEDTVIKRRREAVIRALGDVSQTRTWNLFIDVIAQTGRFPSSASSPPASTPPPPAASAFQVDGEARLWTSIAIDRPTGRIIQKSTESVYE